MSRTTSFAKELDQSDLEKAQRLIDVYHQTMPTSATTRQHEASNSNMVTDDKTSLEMKPPPEMRKGVDAQSFNDRWAEQLGYGDNPDIDLER